MVLISCTISLTEPVSLLRDLFTFVNNLLQNIRVAYSVEIKIFTAGATFECLFTSDKDLLGIFIIVPENIRSRT